MTNYLDHLAESWTGGTPDEPRPAYTAPDPAAVVALVRTAYSCVPDIRPVDHGPLVEGLALSEQVLCGTAPLPKGTTDRLYLYHTTAYTVQQRRSTAATPALVLGALVALFDAALDVLEHDPVARDKRLVAITTMLRGHIW